MPEAQDPTGVDRADTARGSRRGRRHRRRPLLVRYWGVLLVVGLIVMAPWIWNWMMTPHFTHAPLPGYITDPAKLEEEYRLLTGKPLGDASSTQQFQQATDLMVLGNYTDAAILLETISKQAPVPVIFNNLGVLYMKLKDGSQAIEAYRNALARNHDYQPVRANLKRMDSAESADPGSSEVEPNNSLQQANVIWLDRPMEATIAQSVGDVDCFWFTTPRPPRDRFAVEVHNRSISLIPRLRVYDSSGKVLSGTKVASKPGDSLRFDFSSPSNTLYYLQVDGASGSGGDYSVSVSSLHAYDLYEPNDDILNATRIALGQTIEANIMDASDTDFFSFVSPVDASLTIDIGNRSATLIPGLSTFGPDLRHIGFGPDVDAPGGNLKHVMKVAANQPYYVQVWSKNDTTGNYSLMVK
jgi:hypothetical protein